MVKIENLDRAHPPLNNQQYGMFSKSKDEDLEDEVSSDDPFVVESPPLQTKKPTTRSTKRTKPPVKKRKPNPSTAPLQQTKSTTTTPTHPASSPSCSTDYPSP